MGRVIRPKMREERFRLIIFFNYVAQFFWGLAVGLRYCVETNLNDWFYLAE